MWGGGGGGGRWGGGQGRLRLPPPPPPGSGTRVVASCRPVMTILVDDNRGLRVPTAA